MSLADKVAVVTGAGSGIGRAASEGFTADGAFVVGFGRSAASLQETQGLCAGGNMSYVTGDVASETDVEKLFRECQRLHGRVDILFNSAGVHPHGMFMELSQDAWAEAIHTNLLGVALCCRAALLSMLQAGHGRIVTLSSRVAAEAVPGHSAYSVSKAAAMALTQGIAAEIDRNRFPDILINDLIPGMTRSKMNPAGQDPHDVYPFARQLVTLPPGGPSGQVFFQGRPIDIWSRRESFLQKIRKCLLR